MVAAAAPEANSRQRVSQRGDDLAQLVYRLTWKFFQSDAVLAQSMRSAAITVAMKTAASQCAVPARARRALATASVALEELVYCAHLARRLGVLTETEFRRVQSLSAEVRAGIDV